MTDSLTRSSIRERVLAYIDDGDPGHAVIREAARLARQLQAEWVALYIESAGAGHGEPERERIAASQRVVASLGGQVYTVAGTGISDDILAYARANGVTQIVLGQSPRSPWSWLWRGSLARRLVVEAAETGVHVIPVGSGGRHRIATAHGMFRERLPFVGALLTVALVALVTALGTALQPVIETFGIAPMYLAVVLFVAARYGLPLSLLAAILSTLTLDFFFLQPLYEFDIADPRDTIALLTFAAVAVVTSQLSGRLRAEMLTARRRARINAELYSFSRLLGGISTLEELLPAVAAQVGAMLEVRVALLLQREGALALGASDPPGFEIEDEELIQARDAFAGREATHSDGKVLLPLRTGHGTLGVLALHCDSPNLPLSPDDLRLAFALANQAAIAIERIQLAAEIEETRILRESEKLRSALLTSVSHDLRTPLAAVLAALQSLKSEGVGKDDAAHAELLDTAREESERLNRFVGNLLDMTRIEGGAVAPRREPADIADLVGSAARRATKLLEEHRLTIELAPDLPMVDVDFVLMEQVIFNLLDNAAKYAPQGSTVSIGSHLTPSSVVLEIADEGPGIPDGEHERIFSKFHRLKAGDRQRAGTGLGLAICRGFVEAHGGTITARNRSDRQGAVFVISLPSSGSALSAVSPPRLASVAAAAPSLEGDSPRQAR